LRDYGTGVWHGGDPDCDHTSVRRNHGEDEKQATSAGTSRDPIRGGDCRRCGARRVDRQHGLEETPDLYVGRMVDVFREARRVLAVHGTCWVNMGDGYGSGTTADRNPTSTIGPDVPASWSTRSQAPRNGLKPKDLVGQPWRLAFALQADGWWLRSEIIWAKPNPMPESVTDRPTKAHEQIFLLTRSARYWYDADAVREPAIWAADPRAGNGHIDYDGKRKGEPGSGQRAFVSINPSGRNLRSVWAIATQPYPDAHFATFPEEVVRRALLAGCAEWVCRACGRPRERIVDVGYDNPGNRTTNGPRSLAQRHEAPGFGQRLERRAETVGWSDCGHGGDYRPGVILDPFAGSGTVGLVARKHNRRAVLIELNEKYAAMAARRLSQLSLLAEADA
jgi:DNA modification methylase